MTDTTNPLIPAPPQPAVTAHHWVTVWGNFIKAHEKLLIVLLSAFILFKGGQGIENIILKHDAIQAQTAAAKVQNDAQLNKQQSDQLAQLRADNQKKDDELNSEISAALAQLAQQKKKDAVSSPTEIDARWQGLLPLKAGSIIPLDPSTTKITNEAANQTVQALEEIPVLKQQVLDLTTELHDDEKVIIQQDVLIAGLNKQIVDEKAKRDDDVNLEKQKAKHQFWKGFKIGAVIGVVGGEAVRIWAGHP